MSFLKGLVNAIGAIEDAVNNELKVEKHGRGFKVLVEGRFHSPAEPWVYDVTATDLLTFTSVEVKHFLHKEDGIEQAISATMAKMRERGLLRGDGTGGSTAPTTPTTPGAAYRGQEGDRTRGIMKALTKKGLVYDVGHPSSNTTSSPTSITQAATSTTRSSFKAETSKNNIAISHHTAPIEPDVDGLYTSMTINTATPDPSQLDPRSCYVTWESQYKGVVYILNNDEFPNLGETCRTRRGSEVDLLNVEHIFSELGYEPVIHQNLTRLRILASLDAVVRKVNAEGDRHSSACFIFMSHGNQGGISGVDATVGDQRIVTREEIKDKLSGRRCQGLRGKPKLIFIQACRGHAFTRNADELDSSHPSTTTRQSDEAPFEVDFAPPVDSLPSLALDIDAAETSVPDDDLEVDVGGEIPNNADIFVANATSQGYFSIRMRRDGSWFFQALAEVFIAHAHIDDLNELMRKVTCLVSESYRSQWKDRATSRPFEVRQTPAYESQGMRRRFFFLPKYPPS